MTGRAALVLAVITVVAGLGVVPAFSRGQQPIPTPRGQLGGPVPLQLTPSVAPTEAQTATPPTPSPTSPPTQSSIPTTAGSTSALDGGMATTEEIVARVRPAVVTVVSLRLAGGNGTPAAGAARTGSGFFIDDAGHVATAASVVASADAVDVVLADGERRSATVVGLDELTDLAVLRVDGEVPATLPFDGVEAPRPGQTVLAFGTAAERLPNTATLGIVSGTGRGLPGGPLATELIWHDAAAFPGSVGGPLVTLSGAVVGVNVPLNAGGSIDVLPDFPDIPGIEVPEIPAVPGIDIELPELPGPAAAVPGLSFAVPIATVERVSAALIAAGRVAYPFIGASVQDIGPADAAELELPTAAGALVLNVAANGPAAAAGIEEGDLILALDGERIGAERGFAAVLLAHRPGDTVEATVRRGEEELRLRVTLEERPEE